MYSMNKIFIKNYFVFFLIGGIFTNGFAQNNSISNDSLLNSFVKKLDHRMIGPATTSGRITDIAVNPQNHSEYYVAAAYGGVWKTENAGITFKPIFDNYGVQSIGCLAIDPKNPQTIWVGTGENNNQRSVGYGNGIYKSVDGGKSFTCMGLKQSYHIGMIQINPLNTNEIWVAAYGPLWNDGDEKGIYHSTDGGLTWKQMLTSKLAGFNEVHLDPSHNGYIYACAHQRRRHEWTYLGGGPESGIYRSGDKGKTWQKLNNGLPTSDKGRITVEVAHNTPGKLTAVIETQDQLGGVFVSLDYGMSWTRVNDYFSSGNYYQEVFQDPSNDDRLFFMDTYLHYSEDGGKTVKRFPEKFKHVDNHAIWIDPNDFQHLLVGCDGGLYETFDYGQNWSFKENLPITQFYRVAADNEKPFYNLYGGTQDNYSIGGPSRNNTTNGITNEEWFVTVGGDGFKSQVDPTDPNIVYSQWQYGGLIRFDKRTGDQVDIKPVLNDNKEPLVFNWDAPLIISKYNPKKLYFAANRLFVSEDRGNSWKVISPVLGRKLDRNTLPVMGKVWGLDAVAKNQSTSIYGNITSLAEGKNGVLWIGTDDGMVYLSTDDGKNWKPIEIPQEMDFMVLGNSKDAVKIHPFVTDIEVAADGSCFIAFDNHRQGDFKPYVFKTNDYGKKWQKIVNGIPANHPVKTLWLDQVDNEILCVGTEFGLFISLNGGSTFINFTNNLPPIAIKDIIYQEQSKDLILATFGRGFAICDDYHLLRDLKAKPRKWVNEGNHDFFIPYDKVGSSGNGFRGAERFRGENLDEKLRLYVFIDKIDPSPKDERIKKEKKGDYYPSIKEIRQEKEFINHKYILKVRTSDGQEIATVKTSLKKGWNKLSWDLKMGTEPFGLKGSGSEINYGPYVSPGKFVFSLLKYNPETGIIEPVEKGVFGTANIGYLYDVNNLIAFDENRLNNWNSIKNTRKLFIQTKEKFEEIQQKTIKAINLAAWNTSLKDTNRIFLFETNNALLKIRYELLGGDPIASFEFPTNNSIQSDIFNVFYSMNGSLQAPTNTHLTTNNQLNQRLLQIQEKLNIIEKEFDRKGGSWK